MTKRSVLSIILAVVSLGLAVLAYIILLEEVVVRFSIGASGNSTMQKPLAVLIPTALGVGGAVASMSTKDDNKARRKSLAISAVGIGVCIFMIVVNAFMK